VHDIHAILRRVINFRDARLRYESYPFSPLRGKFAKTSLVARLPVKIYKICHVLEAKMKERVIRRGLRPRTGHANRVGSLRMHQ